jgi:hypothetical protein
MTLADLLQWAGSGRKTGTLCLKGESFLKKIFLQNGIIIGSSSNEPQEFLGQFLLSEGLITEQQLKDAFDLQAQTKVMLGRILVKKGLLSEVKVQEILRLKAEETIYSLFLWTEAEFEFLEDELPPGDPVVIEVKVEDVLMEGLRRYDASKKIRELLPHNRLILERSATPLPDEIAARAFPRRIYDLVDGRRTIDDVILEAHASEFNVCQVLSALLQRGFLDIGREEAPLPKRQAPQVPAQETPQTATQGAPPPPGEDSVPSMIAIAKEMIKSGEAEQALSVLEKAARAAGKNPEIHALRQVAEAHFIERAYRHYLPAQKIPVLKKPLEALVGLSLSPEEMFLVSRVNGAWDLASIISISPLREVDALRAFKKLREAGIVDLVDAQAKKTA